MKKVLSAMAFAILDYFFLVNRSLALAELLDAAWGKAIKKIPIEYKKNSKTIDLRGLKPGTYLISLQVDGIILSNSKLEIIK